MKKVTAPSRVRSTATILGLATASLVCLCAGALLAVRFEGLTRLLSVAGGFIGYLYFSAHALREVRLPSVIIDSRPDPERRRPALSQPAAQAAGRPMIERESRRNLNRVAA